MRIDIKQLEFIDKNLRKMVMGLEKETGTELTITSLYRIGDNGVHGQLPLRGLDVRCRDRDAGRMMVDRTNKKWVYDPSRPDKVCAIAHGSGSNYHIHLQVHPNTELRK